MTTTKKKKKNLHPRLTAAAKAKELEVELRRKKVLNLRVTGKTIREIAAHLGVSVGLVHKDLTAVLARTVAETNEVQHVEREVSLARLDRSMNVAWTQVSKKPLEAVDRIVRIEQRRADLLGLDAPKVSIDLQQATKRLMDCVEQVCGSELSEKILTLFVERGGDEAP